MEMIDRPLCYIAGPYTAGDPVENTHNTLRFADSLHDLGFVTCVVPHISLFWHVVNPRHYQHWLDYDLALLKRCDCLFRLPGDSNGADAEVQYAERNNIPVFTETYSLMEWAKEWS